MSSPSESVEPSPSTESSVELDRAAKKKVKDLRYYYKNRERILAAQMVQRREDPEFQERQRVKEEAIAAALAEKEARKAERERVRLERQAEKDLQAAKKAAEDAIKQEKQHQKREEQRIRRETKIKEKALALGLCLPPAEIFSA